MRSYLETRYSGVDDGEQKKVFYNSFFRNFVGGGRSFFSFLKGTF